MVSASAQLQVTVRLESDASIDASASRSAGFTDRLYFCLTATTLAANQPVFCEGLHSAASRSDFSCRFTVGSAMVRLTRSPAISPELRLTEPGIVCLRQRNDVFDVRCRGSVGSNVEQLAGIGRVHLPAGLGQPLNDFVLQRTVRRAEGIPVIACTLDLLTDRQSHPCRRTGRAHPVPRRVA